MAQLFISYSRVDLEFVKRLDERIQTAFPDLKIWRDNAPHGLIGGDNWWEAILRAIAESDVFVYVLSNESVQSLYCQAEFTEARRLQKRIVTIQARDRTELTDELDDIQFIDMKNGPDDPEALTRLVAAISKQLALAKKTSRPLWKPATAKPHKEAPPTRPADAPEVETPPLTRPSAEAEALRLARSGVRWQIIGVVVSVILGLAALALAVIQLTGGGTPTTVVQASIAPATTQSPFRPTDTAVENPTLSNFAQLETAQMQLTDSAATQAAADLNATRETILSVNATGTAQQIAATEAAARATLLALSWTPTPTPTPTVTPTPTPTPTLNPVQTALEAAHTFSGTNADWQALYPEGFKHNFDDGVPMALVPAGSFEMGSTDEEIEMGFSMCQQAADNNATCERSWFEVEAQNGDNTQTFSQPFWIDQTEVTRAQYQQCVDAGECELTPASDYSTQPDQPINRVTWFQAESYCRWRDARLPTEAEWEYAARGPDRWIFPWGNTFDGTLANHCDRNCGEASWASGYNYVNEENDDGYAVTAPVGSYPQGASWVGGLDMSGNVWEWTSSLYEPYPYDPDDGRAVDTADRTDVLRVLRSGSFINASNFLRAPGRYWVIPDVEDDDIGFRCARSYNPES